MKIIKRNGAEVPYDCEKIRAAITAANDEVQDKITDTAIGFIVGRTDGKILSLLEQNNEEAKQENANKNPIINSTLRDYMAGEVSKDICRRFLFPEDIIAAHDEGIIHVHDLEYIAERCITAVWSIWRICFRTAQ